MAVTAPPSLEPMRSERGHASPDPVLPALFRRSRRPLVQVSSSGSLRLVIPAVVPLFSFTSNLFLGGGVRKILLLCCHLASRLPFIYLFCCPPPGTCFLIQREGREGGEGGRDVSVGNIRRLPLRRAPTRTVHSPGLGGDWESACGLSSSWGGVPTERAAPAGAVLISVGTFTILCLDKKAGT